MDIIKHVPYSIKTVFHKVWFREKKELWSGDFFIFFPKVMGKWKSRGERKGSAVLQVSSQLSTPADWKPSLPYPPQKINYPGTPGWWWWISVWQTTETTSTKITGYKTAKNLGDFISAKLVFHDFSFSPSELPLARQNSRFPHTAEGQLSGPLTHMRVGQGLLPVSVPAPDCLILAVLLRKQLVQQWGNLCTFCHPSVILYVGDENTRGREKVIEQIHQKANKTNEQNTSGTYRSKCSDAEGNSTEHIEKEKNNIQRM